MPVERSQKRQARVGAIILAVLILAFLLIFFLADVRRMLTPTDSLVVLMPSAAGLRPGAEVWIAGKPVGEVASIEVRPPDVDSLRRVAVRVQVQRRYLDHIRRDSQARVTSFRVIGDPVLDITPGSPAAAAIAAGDSLLMRASGSAAGTMARARSLHDNLQLLLADTRTLATPARERGRQLTSLLGHLDVTKREFEAFTEAMQSGPINVLSDPQFNRIMGSLGSTVSELQASFSRAAARARNARSEAAPALDRLAARADTISRELNQLQTAVSGGGGLLIRAQTDSSIIKGLRRAQLQLDSLIAETKREPWRFWF